MIWLLQLFTMRIREKGKSPAAIVALALFFCFCVCPVTAAAANKRVLLQLSNMRHWVDTGARYFGSDSEVSGSENSSQKYSFEETYNINIDYAILNKKLANGTLEVGVGSNQDFQHISGVQSKAGSAVGYKIEYLADLFLFERRDYPIYLRSNRYQELIALPFTESYDLTTTNFLSRLNLKHDYLPMELSYNRTETETSGLTIDRNHLTESFSINMSHEIADLSSTSLKVSTRSGTNSLEGAGRAEKSSSYELGGRNVLSWEMRSEQSTLASSYMIREESGTSDLSLLSWGERLNLRLGKALSTGGVYNYHKSLNDVTERRDTRRSVWVKHQLFESLSSRLGYEKQEVDETAGTVDSWSKTASVAYTKTLPRQSRLNLSYGYSYGVIDSDFDVETLPQLDETLVVDVVDNPLQNSNVILGSIKVLSADRLIRYDEGVDYDVVTIGRITRLEFFNPGLSGIIAPGTSVSVDYDYRVDSSLEYATTGNRFAASVSLFSNRYRVYTTIVSNDQELLDGDASISALGGAFVYSLGIDGDLGDYRFGSEYYVADTRDSDEKIFSGFLMYNKSLGGGDVTWRLDERYSVIKQHPSETLLAEVEDKTNYLSLLLKYKKNYSRNFKLKYSAQVTDLRGSIQNRNEISLGLNGEYKWYKFLAFLDANVTWQFSENVKRRNDRLSFTLRRYF